jgi:uncharacterized phage protein (TIGR02220 family)
MSVEAMTWAFTVDLKPCPKSVLVALANRADEDGYCWPGLDDLERRTGWKRRAIQMAIKHLVECQLITVSPRFQASARQDSNLYRLAVEGAPHARGRVHQVHAEGAPHARGRVHQVHGEGAPHAPKSSSEQSSEQSSEHCPARQPDGADPSWSVAEGILDFLNRKTGRRFPARHPNKDPTKSLRMVYALLKRGYSEQQVRQVVGNRLVRWEADAKMKEFLRPKTIFCPENFEQYLGQVGATG